MSGDINPRITLWTGSTATYNSNHASVLPFVIASRQSMMQLSFAYIESCFGSNLYTQFHTVTHMTPFIKWFYRLDVFPKLTPRNISAYMLLLGYSRAFKQNHTIWECIHKQ